MKSLVHSLAYPVTVKGLSSPNPMKGRLITVNYLHIVIQMFPSQTLF